MASDDLADGDNENGRVQAGRLRLIPEPVETQDNLRSRQYQPRKHEQEEHLEVDDAEGRAPGGHHGICER